MGPVTNEDYVGALVRFDNRARGTLQACPIITGPKCEEKCRNRQRRFRVTQKDLQSPTTFAERLANNKKVLRGIHACVERTGASVPQSF